MDVKPVDWETFLKRFKWKQGEHLTLIGPTGQGKSTLIEAIEHKRDYVIVFATKRQDEILNQFERTGYKTVKEIKGLAVEHTPKVILHPPFAKDKPRERYQREQFSDALNLAFDSGNWTLILDEIKYLSYDLSLEREVALLYHQGRSMGVTMIAGVQRPTHVPRVAFTQATHLFFFRTTDEADLKRLGGLGGVDNKAIREACSVLKSHEVLYLNTRDGRMYTTKVEL